MIARKPAANSSSLRDVVEQLFGWSIDTELERFDLPGWYYVGQPPPAECPVCGEGLYAFRYLHERESGTTTLYWALVCSSCADSFEPADLGEAKRELYELSKQGQFRDPVTLDSPPVPAKKPAAKKPGAKAPPKKATAKAPAASPDTVPRGIFVRELGADIGQGQLVEIAGSEAVIEYTDLPGRRTERRSVPIDGIGRTDLPRETRVWIPTKNTLGHGWLPGRVLHSLPDRKIAVKFPQRSEAVPLPLGEVVVRWDKELTACDEAVAIGFTDSVGYYRARIPLVRNLIGQRGACRGFTAAMSASIRPFQHQFNVLARVLGDPVPRFVLADEVGLGKTIEAGLVVRQYLLDDPDCSVVLSVPSPLRSQWTDELSTKFFLQKHLADNRVRVLDHDDLSLVAMDPPTLLVVDEAHRLTEQGLGSPDFEIACAAAARTEGLLLLTATPLRGNAPTFLGLLHLIDPAANPIDDLEGFAERLLLREGQASAIETLNSDLPAVYLDPILAGFRETFPRDDILESLITTVESLAESGGDQFVLAKEEVAAHLRETYRISRRVIRNRRSEVVEAGFPVSGRSFDKITIAEPSRVEIDKFLDRWREGLILRGEPSEWTELFVEGLERALAGPTALLSFVEKRLDGEDESSQQGKGVDGPERILLRDLKARLELEGESEKLKWVVGECARLAMGATGKTVVFTSFLDIAKRLVHDLETRVSPDRYVWHLESDDRSEHDLAIDSFINDSNCRLLICDRSAEEGRNLQTADLAIHFDLPVSPNRLEQRIGRFDRFSERRNHQTQSKIFVEHESEFLSAYLKLMEDGVGVFTESVATLQLPLADLESQVTTNLFVEGVNALRPDLNQLKESLDEERQKIALLEQLEATAIDSDFSLGDFAEFEEFDENWGATAKAFGLLISGDSGIRLETDPDMESPEFKGWFEYRIRPGFQAPALMPHEHFLEMAEDMPGRRSFSRVLARRNKGVKVMGLGDPFVDRVENYLRIDERGRARVTYRHFPELDEPQLWLCFDYLIEFEDHNLPVGKRRRLRRRGDVFFPPMQQAVWTNGQSVPGEDLIRKLEGDDEERDYRHYKEYPVRGARWRTVIELFPDWEEQVRRCADHARELLDEELIEESMVGEKLAWALDRARGDAKRRLQILRLQIERTDDVVVEEVLQTTREREIEILEAVDHGLEEPRVQMIAAGAYVLANQEIPDTYAQ